MPMIRFYCPSGQTKVQLRDGTIPPVVNGYVVADSSATEDLEYAGCTPVSYWATPSNANRLVGLRNPVVIPEVLFAQGPDGRWLGTQYDGTYGNFLARLFVATGTTGNLTKTTLAVTEPAQGLKNAAGTALGSGDIFGAWWIDSTSFLFAVRSIGAPFGTGCCFLYYCKWNGSAWTVGNNASTYDNKQAVLDVGTTGGSSVVNNIVLHARSMDTDGAGNWCIWDYNVNASRTGGGANDQVRIMKSADGGKTWSKLLSWNTSGNQIRHVHACRYDPYGKKWYFLLGDAPNNCIIRWDGTSTAPADNTALSNFKLTPGWEVIQDGWPTESGDLSIHSNGIMYLPDDIGFVNGVAAQLRSVLLGRDFPMAYHLGDYFDWFASQANPARAPLISCNVPGGKWSIWGSLFDMSKDASRGYDFWAVDPDGFAAYKIATATDYGSATAGTLWNMLIAANEQKLVISGAPSSGSKLASNYGSIVATLTPWDGSVLQLN